MQSKIWTISGTGYGFLSVALGAFGAHALKGILSEPARAVYQTAVQYQMFHALALIGLGLWSSQNPQTSTLVPGIAYHSGIILFSGSLYALALTDQRILGAITPLGGIAFLIGWITFAISVWKA